MNTFPAIFLDRDGTINIDTGYVSQPDDFVFIEGAIDACYQLKKMGFLLVIVTNQSGIARNLFTEQQFESLTEWMDWSLLDKGVTLDGIYYCPHHPHGSVPKYTMECDCRKPLPGMIQMAQQDLHIDLAHSYMVGDKTSDLLAGKAAKIGKLILVESGKPIDQQARDLADFCVASLAELPDLIKKQQYV